MCVNACVLVAEVTAVNLQGGPHPTHEFEYGRFESRPPALGNVTAQGEVMIAPDADRAARGQQGSDLGSTVGRREGVAGVPDCHNLFHGVSAEQVERSIKLSTVVVYIGNESQTHGNRLSFLRRTPRSAAGAAGWDNVTRKILIAAPVCLYVQFHSRPSFGSTLKRGVARRSFGLLRPDLWLQIDPSAAG